MGERWSCTIGIMWLQRGVYCGGRLTTCQYFGGQLSDFSSRLKDERKRLKLSQAQLGEAGGVSKDAQLNYENGSRSPSASYLELIAREGVDVQFLLTGKRSSPDFMPEEVLTLIRAYEGSSEDGRRALQMVALLAIKQSPTNAGEPGNTVNIGGDVGQQVNGDQTITAPVSFSVGKRK